MNVEFLVIGVGAFFAGLVNAAFATGGVFVLLAATTAVLPMTAAVPLQGVFSASSILMRIWLFRHHLSWPTIIMFIPGGAIGAFFGVRVFVTLDEAFIATAVGLLLLGILWMPSASFRLSAGRPFFAVGIAHGFLGTLFGVGTMLQPLILLTDLKKLQITGTLAMCLFVLDIIKTTGYVLAGFDYAPFLPHIVIATLAGIAGVFIGKRITHRISEAQFRMVLKGLISLVALRLVFKGLFLA